MEVATVDGWTSEFLHKLPDRISALLTPENCSLIGKLGTNIYGICTSLAHLCKIDQVDEAVQLVQDRVKNPDHVIMVVKDCKFNSTKEQEFINCWTQAGNNCENQKTLLEMLQDERRSVGNRTLGFSSISSGIAIYFQYLAIQAVAKQIDEANGVAKESEKALFELLGKLKDLEKEAEKLVEDVKKCPDDGKEICPKLINGVLWQTNRLILKLNDIAIRLSELKLHVKNGITTLKTAAAAQHTAMKLNCVQGALNLAHLSVGTAAHPALQGVFGVLTAGFFALAFKNHDLTICCEKTLDSLTKLLATIEDLDKLVKKIQGYLDEAGNIMRR